MGTLQLIGRELLGLLLDDGRLALGLLAWTAIFGGAFAFVVDLPALLAGAVLAVGYLAILRAFVHRRAGGG